MNIKHVFSTSCICSCMWETGSNVRVGTDPHCSTHGKAAQKAADIKRIRDAIKQTGEIAESAEKSVQTFKDMAEEARMHVRLMEVQLAQALAEVA